MAAALRVPSVPLSGSFPNSLGQASRSEPPQVLPQVPPSVERRLLSATRVPADQLAVPPDHVSNDQGALPSLVRDELATVVPQIREMVERAVRHQFSLMEATVQRHMVTQIQSDPARPLGDMDDARRHALGEAKIETKKFAFHCRESTETHDWAPQEASDARMPEWVAGMRWDLQGDIRQILREELAIQVRPPHKLQHAGGQAWPASSRQETWRNPPPADSEESVALPEESSPPASQQVPLQLNTMKTSDLKDLMENALDDPTSTAAAEFAEDLAEAMDNPKLMESTIFKILPKGRVSQIMHPLVHWVIYLEEPARSGFLNALVNHHRFEFLCNIVIVCNAVYAAYTADWEMKHINQEPDPVMYAAELSFMTIYMIELLMKLIVHRLYFFCNEEWAWNHFDFLLVMLSLYEQVMALAGIGSGSSVTFMRIFRLLKLTKILRLFRALKFLQELRLMMAAIARTMSALFWAMVMVTFFFFVFGLVMLQGLTGYLSEANSSGETLLDDDVEEVMAMFGSMSNAMLTLYMVTTGGDDWGNAYKIVTRAGSLYSAFFLFYIAFFVFAVMNILTGMIVENVSGLAAQDVEAAVLTYRRERKEVAEEARNLFAKLDEDGSGQLAQAEFEEALKSDQMHALLSAMDLDVQDGRMFFEILRSCSDADSVSVNNFINGCMRMKGNSTAIDMQTALIEIRAIHQKVAALSGMKLGRRCSKDALV